MIISELLIGLCISRIANLGLLKSNTFQNPWAEPIILHVNNKNHVYTPAKTGLP